MFDYVVDSYEMKHLTHYQKYILITYSSPRSFIIFKNETKKKVIEIYLNADYVVHWP